MKQARSRLKTNEGCNIFMQHVVNLWNSLPQNIGNAKYLNGFQSKKFHRRKVCTGY